MAVEADVASFVVAVSDQLSSFHKTYQRPEAWLNQLAQSNYHKLHTLQCLCSEVFGKIMPS